MSESFEHGLRHVLRDTAERFGTPFYLYDAEGIERKCRTFTATFRDTPSRSFFPVKALPNPTVLGRLHAQGFGFDCSSPVELALALRAGAGPDDLLYTANNTRVPELSAAIAAGALVTIDDEATLEALVRAGEVPSALSVRINPGSYAPQFDSAFFGAPRHAKFGVPVDRIVEVCRRARSAGVRTFGLHMMISSNSLDPAPASFTLDFLTEQAIRLRDDPGIDVRWIDVGGGFGIPFRPDEPELDLAAVAENYRRSATRWPYDWRPTVHFENGSYITAPHGVLVTRVVSRMTKWRDIVGVDVSTNALMRPVIYDDVYHHITAPLVEDGPPETVDVVGSLCTNLDRLATDRDLPPLAAGDLLVIHDAGAHGHAMGHTYNGRLRPKELLMHADGSVELIRRAETETDYLATLTFSPRVLPPRLPSRAGARPTRSDVNDEHGTHGALGTLGATAPAGPVRSYNEWDPLEEVIVGTMRGAAVPAWDSAVEATMPGEAAEVFRRNAGGPWPREHARAAEDELDSFADTLEGLGVTVTRPEAVDHTRGFSTPRWSSPAGLYSAMPRDLLLIVGDLIIESPMAWRSRYFEADAYHRLLTDYFRRGARWIAAPRPLLDTDTFDDGFDRETPFATGRYVTTEVEPTFDAADFTRCGTDLFVQRSHVTNQLGIDWVARHLGPDYTVHTVEMTDPSPMHIDGSFVPLAPGKLLLNPAKVKTIPEALSSWEARWAPEPALPPDHELYMSSRWVSMNVLMLSETRVVVEAGEEPLIAMLTDWGFDVLPVPFRNVMRFGGCFHCVTADVRRRGELRSVL